MKISKTHELRNRVIFTVFVLIVYLLARTILLFGVSADDGNGADAQSIFQMMLSGDRYRNTIMALGIIPYINASLLVQIISALKSAASRTKVSKQKSDRWLMIAGIIIAGFMAVITACDMDYSTDALPLAALRTIAAAEMFCGSMLATFLCMKNEKHGIGVSMPIILVNILTSLSATLAINHYFRYAGLIVGSLAVIAITIFMENSIIKIPMQRVSIHNIHAEQNYLAYKRTPMGIMPVMLAATAFVIPGYFIRMLMFFFPDSASLVEIYENMQLTKPEGIVVYLVIIFVLTIAFSMIMLNPWETANQLQRNGDSIIGMYPGRDTAHFLAKTVLKWSFVSAILQAGCMAVSLILAYTGVIPAGLAMVPASIMIVVSIACSLAQESAVYCRYDAYKFFV